MFMQVTGSRQSILYSAYLNLSFQLFEFSAFSTVLQVYTFNFKLHREAYKLTVELSFAVILTLDGTGIVLQADRLMT